MKKILSVILVLTVSSACLADDEPLTTFMVPSVENSSRIDGEVMSNAQGRMAVNEAAGDNNMQFSGAAIAVDSDLSDTLIISDQHVRLGDIPGPMRNRATIEGNAFSSARGAISINQVSGAANSQANAFAISFGMQSEVLSDIELEQSAAISNLDILKENPVRNRGQVTIGEASFKNAQGIIQINQTAGVANQSANAISIRVIEGPQ